MNQLIKRNRIQALFRICVSLALVILVIRSVDISSLTETLLDAHLKYILLAVILVMAAWVVAAYKWLVIFPNNAATFWDLLKLILISTTYSFTLPGGQLAGEIGKGLHLTTTNKHLDKLQIVASIVVDKAFGLISVFILGLTACILFIDTPTPILLTMALGSTGGLIYLILLLINKKKNIIHEKTQSFKFLRKVPDLIFPNNISHSSIIISFFLSICYQILLALIIVALAKSISYTGSVVFVTWVWLITNIIQSIPITIAGIGLRDVTITQLFKYFGYSPVIGAGLSILIFFIFSLAALIGGVLLAINRAPRHPNITSHINQ